jgi:PPOX class probable F420-dependent enzyme
MATRYGPSGPGVARHAALTALLTPAERRFLADARRAVLATVDPAGLPRLVPICFVLSPAPDERGRPVVISPLDEKPKSVRDPLALARVRDVLARPRVRLLVDRWDEDWTRLGWLRLDAVASLVAPGEPGHAAALVTLRRKYPQYVRQRLETRPLVRIAIERASSWGDLSG